MKKKPAGIELKVPSLPSLEAHFAMKVDSNKIKGNPLFPTGRPHPSRESMVVLQWSPYMPQAIEMYQYV